MSFPRYERYKNSGVDWLGEVPEHWEVYRSRRLFSQRKELVRDSDEQLTASQKHGIVTQEFFMQAEGRAVVRVIHGAEILKHVEPDDFVISMRSFQGGLEWSGIRGCISSAYVMLAPSASVYPGFFRHLFKSSLYIQALQTTSNLVRDGQAMRYENFTVVDLPLPSIPEQQSVALFLDQQVDKIEKLIEEQRRLIELLKEKRQAVISHAVTRGISPNIPLANSGVASFGLIPSHWAIRKIHALAKVGNGSTPSRERFDYWDGGEFPWLSSTVVNQEEVSQADQFVTQLALRECHLPRIFPPAVLIGITGQGKTRGMATTLRFEATINQHIAAVIPRTVETNVDFLRLVFDMLYIDLRTDSEGGGSTKGAITCEQIQSLRIALPPTAEQIEIASWIKIKSGEFIALIGQAESAIGLLQERRSALISAAVTGKIDVRNYNPKEAA